MNCHGVVFGLLACMLIPIVAHRTAFEDKCKRTCSAAEGKLDCWTATADGFAYGLSTAMVDFCQAMLKLRAVANDTRSWYETSRKILMEEVEKYELDEVQQLSKADVEQIAISLLDKCYNASSMVMTSEPPCPACSDEQTRLIKQWQLSAIVLFSVGGFLVAIVFAAYALFTYYVRRSYASV